MKDFEIFKQQIWVTNPYLSEEEIIAIWNTLPDEDKVKFEVKVKRDVKMEGKDSKDVKLNFIDSKVDKKVWSEKDDYLEL